MRRLLLVLLLVVTGCADSPSAPSPRTLTVFAAASLNKAFTELGRDFGSANPGVRVQFSFAGSQALVAQVREGAPASVLATADVATMDSVKEELDGEPVVFAMNQLAIVTATGNPLSIRGLPDLARPGVLVVLAGPTVPVGKAAARALASARVIITPVSLEDAVTGVVTKVRLGEADAGIAYVTDLVGNDVGGIPIPDTATSLAIAAIKDTPASDDAARFIAFVRSAAGREVLTSFGFR